MAGENTLSFVGASRLSLPYRNRDQLSANDAYTFTCLHVSSATETA